jgi:hypothetical protein
MNKLTSALYHYNMALRIDPNHREHEIGAQNVGHISKMFNINMDQWNKEHPILVAEVHINSVTDDDEWDLDEEDVDGDADDDNDDNNEDADDMYDV